MLSSKQQKLKPEFLQTVIGLWLLWLIWTLLHTLIALHWLRPSITHLGFLTCHKSLMETLVLDSRPNTSHLAVIVAAFEHRFQRATTKRCPLKGPAQTWNTKLYSSVIQGKLNRQQNSWWTENNACQIYCAPKTQIFALLFYQFCLKNVAVLY